MEAINFYIVRSREKGSEAITPMSEFDAFETEEECLSYCAENTEQTHEIFVLYADKMELKKIRDVE